MAIDRVVMSSSANADTKASFKTSRVDSEKFTEVAFNFDLAEVIQPKILKVDIAASNSLKVKFKLLSATNAAWFLSFKAFPIK